MNDTEKAWILERAARVLDRDTYAMLDNALSRPVSPSSGDQSGVPDADASKADPGPSAASASETEAEMREAWGR